MENRTGLVAQGCLIHAIGTVERAAAPVPVDWLDARRRITLGARTGAMTSQASSPPCGSAG